VVLCLVLVAAEVYRYVVPVQKEHMVVDPGIEGRLRINFDITFPALQCSEANLDAMDVAGEQQNGIDHDMTKTRCVPGGRGWWRGGATHASGGARCVREAAVLIFSFDSRVSR
jgi:hypothetical protein